MEPIQGHCLCGAVTVRVTAYVPDISACHCDMCRRWTGTTMMGFEAPASAVSATGPVRAYASSSFAERAFCGTCGSALWYRYTGEDADTDTIELVPGLFGDAADFRLRRELYADRAPKGYAFAGDHDRITRADYEAQNPYVSEETSA